ncbi:Tar ligand binding domain-containing protein [Oxalobacteraceae sp. CFBP 8763]|nr:Tar ligand binding domain-containing protein [Oxalobacteraceae sp. CFBP 8763]
MLSKLTLRFRLIATLAVLGLLIAAIGVLGIYGMRSNHAALEQVYSNQLASSIAINNSKNFLNRARFGFDRAVFHPDAPDVAKTIARAKGFIDDANKSWQTYLTMSRDGEESALAKTLETERTRYINDGMLALATALEQGNSERIEALSMKEMTALYGVFDKASVALDDYQLATARHEFESSLALFTTLMWAAGLSVVFGLVLAIVSSVLLLRAIMRPLEQAIGHFDAMAHGDLSTTVVVDRQDEMGALLKGLASMQEQLSGTVRSVRDSSMSIATASAEIAAGNMNLSGRTEQQASSLEETASSLEELTSTVQHNADNVRQANNVARSASEVAIRGGKLVGDVVETMSAINASSKRIVDIISVIDGIAFQTNILALNAAVEAARAGEQGRGFAVVASEVRNLAQRSAAAAKEIKELIGTSVTNVEAGTALVDSTGTTMNEIVSSVKRVSDIMAEILAAGEEQTSGIGQINEAVSLMDQATQQNAALVEEAAAATGALQEQAQALQQMVSVFKVDAQATGHGHGRALGHKAQQRIAIAA